MKRIFAFFISFLLVFSVCNYSQAENDRTLSDMAEKLKALGLFMGSNKGFELERAPTRAEAGILFVKLLGKGQAVADTNYTHPFTDVPASISSFIGYMYQNDFTAGIGNNKFGTDLKVTADSYVTFLLKALGYSLGSDFTVDTAIQKAVSIGIISREDAGKIGNRPFIRGDIVSLSYKTLDTYMKGGAERLIERLITSNAVDGAVAVQVGLVESINVPKNFPYKDPGIYEDDKYFYQSNGISEYQEESKEFIKVRDANAGIYQVDKATGESKLIYDGPSTVNYVGDEWVYFAKLAPIQLPPGVKTDKPDGLKDNLGFSGEYKINKASLAVVWLSGKRMEILHCDNKGILYLESTDSTSGPDLKYSSHDGQISKTLERSFYFSKCYAVGEKVYFYRGDIKTVGLLDLEALSYRTVISNIEMKDFVTDGRYIYYTNLADGGSLYRINADGTEKLLLTGDTCIYLFAEGNYLYFINASKAYQPYRMNLENNLSVVIPLSLLNAETKRKMQTCGLHPFSGYGYSSAIDLTYKEFLYYVDNAVDGCLYRMDIATGRITRLTKETVCSYEILNDVVFFTKSIGNGMMHRSSGLSLLAGIYQMKLEGSDQKLINNDTASRFQSNENIIFYEVSSYQNKLTKYFVWDHPEYARPVPQGTAVQSIKVYENYIFYISAGSSSKQSLHRINIDGSNDILLISDVDTIGNYYTKNGWIYFEQTDTKRNPSHEYMRMRLDGTDKQTVTAHDFFY